MRNAVVGSGFVAGLHLEALAGVPGAEIAGVVDVDGARAAATARRSGGVPSATDLPSALADWGVDAAVVCTPNDTHAAIAGTLAAAGVHALVEKPLATSVTAARAAARAFEDAGLVLAAAHTHRFADYARAVKAAVEAGETGHPRHARLTLLGGWIWGDWRNWQTQRARSGGHALHNGVHLLDLVTWWLDAEPVSVHAQGVRQASGRLEIHDYLLMTVGYANGASAVCEMSRANRPRDLAFREAEVRGTGGFVRVPWGGGAPTLLAQNRTPGPLPVESDPFAAQAHAWIAAVRGEKSAVVGGRDGVRAVTLGVAAEASLASGRVEPVTVEEAPVQDIATEPVTEPVTEGVR